MNPKNSPTRPPFVAIVGGFWALDDTHPDLSAPARDDARDIGRALARAGFGLITYLHNEKSLEPYVVEGYCEAVEAGATERIRVIYPSVQNVRFKEQAQEATRRLFVDMGRDIRNWVKSFYGSLVREPVDDKGVDGVLIFAGGRTTLVAGHLAYARDLPMLVVDKYPGSAKRLREDLPEVVAGWEGLPVEAHVAAFRSRCDEAVRRRRVEAKARADHAAARSQRAKLWTAAIALLALAAAAGLVAVNDALGKGAFLGGVFASMILAGVAGALAAAFTWLDETMPWGAYAVRGGLAGFAVGLSYLLPLFWANLNFIDLETPVAPADRAAFLAAVVVALAAGVASDRVLGRLRDKGDAVPLMVGNKKDD